MEPGKVDWMRRLAVCFFSWRQRIPTERRGYAEIYKPIGYLKRDSRGVKQLKEMMESDELEIELNG